jgi:hypothetical protein
VSEAATRALPRWAARRLNAEWRKLDRASALLACVVRLIANQRPVDVLDPTKKAQAIVARSVTSLQALSKRTS